MVWLVEDGVQPVHLFQAPFLCLSGGGGGGRGKRKTGGTVAESLVGAAAHASLPWHALSRE